MFKKTAVFILLLLIFFLPGCWGRRELSELAVILGAGVDAIEGGKLRLTVQIAIPSKMGGAIGDTSGEGPAGWVVSAEGRTIEEANRHLALLVPRNVYWGHCLVLIIGERLAQKDTRLIINFFERRPDVRETMWYTVAKGEARDIISTSSHLQTTSAQTLAFLNRLRAFYPVKLYQFAEMLASKGDQPVLPVVEAVEDGSTLGQGPQRGGAGNKQVKLSGSAVFKESKMIGKMNGDETRGLLWLKNQVAFAELSVPSPSEPERLVTIRIIRSNTKIEPHYNGQNLSFDVKILAEGTLVEQQSVENVATPEKFKKLEQAGGEEIKSRCAVTLEKAQHEFGVDIFGFGDAFHRKYKKEWPKLRGRWDEEFCLATVNIEADVRIREIGLLTKRASYPEE